MIQSFNKFSQSRLAKVFLAIVALSFIVFFGGGSWFRSQQGTNVVAEVGGMPITLNELNKKLHQHAEYYQAHSGKTLTMEEMLAARLPELLLEQLVQEKLLSLETQHLGLTVSDDALRAQIQGMKVFQNDKGEFDKARFTQLLHSHGISEEVYLAEARHEMIQNQLISSVVAGAFLPQDMIDRLFDAAYQQRQAAMMLISPKDMPAPPSPSDSALEAFYKEHQKNFKTPELRTLTGLVISPDAMMKDIPVTEEEIKATYEEKLEALGKKPLSDVRGVVVSAIQKEKALEKMHEITQRLEDEVAGGTTFEELVSTVPGASLVKLETLPKQERQRGEPWPLLYLEIKVSLRKS
jgi:peptidyl-prolyl cis-trans isomerase D